MKRDYLNFNRSLIENKIKMNQDMKEERRKIAEDRQREVKIQIKQMEKNKYLENEMKRSQIEQQKIYKNMLDSQKNEKSNSNINKNEEQFYKATPCIINFMLDTDKKYELGGTILEHNPIVNPVPNYRNNKYLYRDGLNNSLKFVGNNIIG